MTRYAEIEKALRQWAELEDCGCVTTECEGTCLPALSRAALALPEDSIRPIDRDEEFDRTYIPLPGGWEVQTKGKGSTFRICDTKSGRRLAIPPSPYLHETLEQMAREIHAAVAQHAPEDNKVVNAELYDLSIALADFRANQLAKVSSDQIMRESKSCKDALRYLSLREASGEPMPYKVIRDGGKVRFE